MLENLLKEINPFYSEPIINHIILSVSIIVAGMFTRGASSFQNSVSYALE